MWNSFEWILSFWRHFHWNSGSWSGEKQLVVNGKLTEKMAKSVHSRQFYSILPIYNIGQSFRIFSSWFRYRTDPELENSSSSIQVVNTNKLKIYSPDHGQLFWNRTHQRSTQNTDWRLHSFCRRDLCQQQFTCKSPDDLGESRTSGLWSRDEDELQGLFPLCEPTFIKLRLVVI